MTESHSPTVPSRATRPTLRSCQLSSRSVNRRVVTAGTRKSAVTRRAPTTVSAAVTARATRPSSTASKSRGLGPGESTRVGSKPMRSQCWPIRRLAMSVAAAAQPASTRSPPLTKSRLPNSSVSMFEPDSNTSLARITPPARQPTRTSATTASWPVRRPRNTDAPAAKTAAAPKAPSAAGKPSPSARTRPGKAAVPIACEKNARPRSTIQVPRSPAGIARISTSTKPRCTKGS